MTNLGGRGIPRPSSPSLLYLFFKIKYEYEDYFDEIVIYYYVNLHILIKLYYSLIYPFLIYGLLVWGSTYHTNINPLLILQKRALRIMTFSKFDAHSSPLFKLTNILKLFDLTKYQISILCTNSMIIYYL